MRFHLFPRPIRTSAPYHSPRRVPIRQLMIPNAVVSPDFLETTRIVGKGITMFVLFAATMNWWYFKRTREDAEASQKKEDDNKFK